MNGEHAALVVTRDVTLAAFAATPEQLARSYAPGKWTLRQLLLHLVDTEGVLLDRLHRLAADDKPLLWPFDENRWMAELGGGARSLATAATLFTATRAAVLELASLVPPERWTRAGVHAEAGRTTFGEVLQKVHRHNAHHLEQVRACIAGTAWRPPG